MDDREYFLRRARTERAIGSAAKDSSAASAHLRMAEEYERRASELTGDADPANDATGVTSHAV